MNQPENNEQIDQQYSQLMQAAMERELTAEELARIDDLLAQNKAELADFEAVDHLLAKLPDVIVPSNFTARVLGEAPRQTNDQARGRVVAAAFSPQYRSINWLLLRLWPLLEFLATKTISIRIGQRWLRPSGRGHNRGDGSGC